MKPVKHKLRLTLDESTAPTALPFPGRAPRLRGTNDSAGSTDDLVKGVERAMEDAQERLNRLRDLYFNEVTPDGPRAA